MEVHIKRNRVCRFVAAATMLGALGLGSAAPAGAFHSGTPVGTTYGSQTYGNSGSSATVTHYDAFPPYDDCNYVDNHHNAFYTGGPCE